MDAGTEAIIELVATKAAKKAVEEHARYCPQYASIVNMGTKLDNVADTLYGNNTSDNPGLKTLVHDLNKTIEGDANESGLRKSVTKIRTAYNNAKSGWNILLLQGGILIGVATISISTWIAMETHKQTMLQQTQAMQEQVKQAKAILLESNTTTK